MARRSPSTPKTPKQIHHERSSISTPSSGRAPNPSGKVTKSVTPKTRRKPDGTKRPVAHGTTRTLRSSNKQQMAPIIAGSFGSSSSFLSDAWMLDEAQSNTQLVNGELVVADAIAPEPRGQEEPQEPTVADQMLAGLKLETEEPKPDDKQKRTQFFRRISVLFDGDLENKKMQTLRAFLDTGSLHSLIFESGLNELECRFSPFGKAKYLYSVENRRFSVIGKKELMFKYRGKDKEHSTNVYILKDPPDGTESSFDILLGREHLVTANAVQVNTDVVGETFQVSHNAPSHRHLKPNC
ncbi:hypothetical protein LTR70_010018 [Exophiala xenobiotica]|uniref:Uncharacterized protein n=1 Tax=Lithohypha guttulata TaxID=1690604 RepID=A0ABR0JVZ5_9EURO|nr:hypothetical protein LTR24_009984 [Lithohypha guttulata]KAK5309749.1 hypothetical protein LTR70_010018 [Exophiala xenobiotica]